MRLWKRSPIRRGTVSIWERPDGIILELAAARGDVLATGDRKVRRVAAEAHGAIQIVGPLDLRKA